MTRVSDTLPVASSRTTTSKLLAESRERSVAELGAGALTHRHAASAAVFILRMPTECVAVASDPSRGLHSSRSSLGCGVSPLRRRRCGAAWFSDAVRQRTARPAGRQPQTSGTGSVDG